MRLALDFYARPVLTVARECIGKILVHKSDAGETRGRIVEAEAYRGPRDLAAHSAGGRRTPRTEVMFGRAGHAYVFFVYGMHWNFNVVAGQIDEPHAILIRAIEPISGMELMSTRRGMLADRVELCNGPGKLCQAFGIDRAHYGIDLCRSPELFLLDAPALPVLRSPRIGIDYAGEWASKNWRFFAKDSRWVSKTRAAQKPGPRLARQPSTKTS